MNRGSSQLVVTILLIAAAACAGKRQRQADLDVAQRPFNQQEYEESIAAFERVLKDKPNDWRAHYQIALGYLVLYHPGSTDPRDQEYARKATTEFEVLLQMTPPADQPEERKNVAGFYVALLNASEQYDKAIQYYETLRAQAPDDLKAIEMLAELYYNKKHEFKPAMELYERLAELDSSNPERWYTVGQRYWNREYSGNKEGTISVDERLNCIKWGMAALDEALRLDPDYMEAIAYYNLLWREQSKVLRQLGDDVGAYAALEKAKDLENRANALRDRRKASR
jgi:tetratricopeptide (TPR) repeat protein